MNAFACLQQLIGIKSLLYLEFKWVATSLLCLKIGHIDVPYIH